MAIKSQSLINQLGQSTQPRLIYYLGIDAHQRHHTALLSDQYEQAIDSIKVSSDQVGVNQLITWLSKLHHQYRFNNQQLVVGIEGGNRYKDLLVSVLLNQGYQVYEVNPTFTQSRRLHRPHHDKTDEIDAALIVEVLSRQRLALSPMSRLAFDPQSVCLQHWVRLWEDLSTASARLKNQIKRLKAEQLTAPAALVRSTLDQILKLKHQELYHIQQTQARLKATLSGYLADSQARHLTSIKGISTILAVRLIAKIKDIHRFKNLNAFIKYAGVAPTSHSSGQRYRHRRSKTGHRGLHSILYLIALNQVRWNPVSQAYYAKKLAEGKTKRQALRCLMKRMACIIYGVLKSQQPYQAPITT